MNKVKEVFPAAWVFWVATLLTVLPLANLTMIEMAYTHDAVSEDIYLRLLSWNKVLKTPGLQIPNIFGNQPMFWVAHSRGNIFLKDLGTFLVFNFLGWFAVFWLADYSAWGRRRKQREVD